MYNLNFKMSHLLKLTNQEFSVAYNMLFDMVVEDDSTVEYVSKALASVKEQSKKLVFLRNMKRKHHLTGPVNELKLLRNDYFCSLAGKVKYGLKSPNDTEREAAQVLDLWLDAYRDPLSKARIVQQTSLQNQMAEEVKNDTRIKEAMIAAGLMEIMESIELVTTDLLANFKQRRKERTAARRKATDLRRAAYAEMKMFLNSIEMALKLKDGDTEEYLGYAKEINETLDYYRAIVLNRQTRRKNAELENESTENESTENEMLDGDNEPAKAENGVTFGAMALNGMDLQGGNMPKNGSSNGAPAMSRSIINNGVATTNGDTKTADNATTNNGATELATGNGAMDSDTEVSGVNADAATNEDSDQES